MFLYNADWLLAHRAKTGATVYYIRASAHHVGSRSVFQAGFHLSDTLVSLLLGQVVEFNLFLDGLFTDFKQRYKQLSGHYLSKCVNVSIILRTLTTECLEKLAF